MEKVHTQKIQTRMKLHTEHKVKTNTSTEISCFLQTLPLGKVGKHWLYLLTKEFHGLLNAVLFSVNDTYVRICHFLLINASLQID